MQAIKRYAIALFIISLVVLFGFLRVSESQISVNGKFSASGGRRELEALLYYPLAQDNQSVHSSPNKTNSLGPSHPGEDGKPTLHSNEPKEGSGEPAPEATQLTRSDVEGYAKTDMADTDSETQISSTVEGALLNLLMKQTGLNKSQLDEAYNMTKVVDVDLHDLEFLDNYYRYNHQSVEEVVERRMKRVQTVCEEIHFRKTTHYNLYQFNEIGLTWCPVFKSGSTTWRNFFIKEFVTDPPETYFLNLLKPRQLLGSKKAMIKDRKQLFREESEKNIRFTMVRHPFARLVSHVKSSGRDHEMVNQKDLWIYSAIVAGRSNRIANNVDIPRFKNEFQNYISWLKNGKPGEVFNERSPDNPFLNPPYPQLSELVNHIMKMRRSGRDWDGHWMPAHEFCNLCSNKFDYIIRLEDEPLELWYLVDKLGLWDHRTKFLNRANTSSKKETEMADVWSEIERLDRQQKEFLSRHFDVDFRMFGYHRNRVF